MFRCFIYYTNNFYIYYHENMKQTNIRFPFSSHLCGTLLLCFSCLVLFGLEEVQSRALPASCSSTWANTSALGLLYLSIAAGALRRPPPPGPGSFPTHCITPYNYTSTLHIPSRLNKMPLTEVCKHADEKGSAWKTDID